MPSLRGVPPFDPLRVRGSRQRLRRALLRHRRATAAGLAVTVAALAATGAGGALGAAGAGTVADSSADASTGATAAPSSSGRDPAQPPARMVSAPVRIADAATVGLLRRGDRVDVIAAAPSPLGSAGVPERESEARVVARGARVTEIPGERETSSDGGALVVLSVPRATAAALAGASATSQLAVTLC